MFRRIKRHHNVMISYGRAIFKSFTRPVFSFLVGLALSLMATATPVVYFLEHDSNPALGSFLDAAYFVVTTMTGVGFGDIVPKTSLGKIFSMFLMLLGTALYACFTAAVASAILEMEFETGTDQKGRR